MATSQVFLALLLSSHVSDCFSSKTAFLIVDVQNCFVPGGTLAVPNGSDVVDPINKILKEKTFDLVIRSQDWHCKNHVSFASQHKNISAFGTTTLNYTATGKLCGNFTYNNTQSVCTHDQVKHTLTQTLWPDHCVIGTKNADFVSGVNFPKDVVTVRKGYHCEVDSYSAFYDNGKFSHTELDRTLKEAGISTVYVAGLASDYCVSWTAKDAKILGYESFVVTDASKAIASVTYEKEKGEWKKMGVKTVTTDDLLSASSQMKPVYAVFVILPSILLVFL